MPKGTFNAQDLESELNDEVRVALSRVREEEVGCRAFVIVHDG